MTYSCACPCGATKFEIIGEPITRFYCHCTICQQQYDAPFVDVTLFKLADIQLPSSHNILFAKYKRFSAVERGRCPSCEKPILAKLGGGEKGFAFVATKNYVNTEALAKPDMHVFYGTRTDDQQDNLPKYKNSITSYYAFFRIWIQHITA